MPISCWLRGDETRFYALVFSAYFARIDITSFSLRGFDSLRVFIEGLYVVVVGICVCYGDFDNFG